MVDASSAELLRELNEKTQKPALAPLTLGGSVVVVAMLLLGGAPKWVIALVALVGFLAHRLAVLRDELSKTTVIFYNLEAEVESGYSQLHSAFADLSTCARAWHLEAKGKVLDSKYHAGAGAVVKRKSVVIRKGAPPYVKTNVEVPLVPAGKQLLAFMPDRLLVFDNSIVGSVSYKDLVVDVNESKFIEDESVPSDAAVVGTTWRYVNKKGGPDRRFKDNREIPVCAYSQLHLSSSSGLNEVIQLSRRGVGQQFIHAISTIRANDPAEIGAATV